MKATLRIHNQPPFCTFFDPFQLLPTFFDPFPPNSAFSTLSLRQIQALNQKTSQE
jgi:hypothetical protein